ncbi:MAG: TetR/AcrR family transcriptional regulator [Lachnospiraceae bacterium]
MNEKKIIIYSCGKELFEEKGFKDTGVSEIMKCAGMAAGTFYNYYDSKDALFMEIYNEENAKLKRRILDSLDPEGGPMEIMQELIMKNQQGMAENPILREWYNRDIFQRLEQSFREANGLDHVDFLYDSFIEIVRDWQIKGKMRSDINAEIIMAIFSALVNVELHKDEIGLQFFPKVLDYLAEFTMAGLMQNVSDKKN